MTVRVLPEDMGYQVIDVGALDATPDRPSTQRSVSDAAGLSNVSVNRYEAAPGEQLPLAYHVHDEQEEVFYVLDGRMHVETPGGEFVVDADSSFVVDPGSPSRVQPCGRQRGGSRPRRRCAARRRRQRLRPGR
jgi:mannose-6-phosphate isomerase-like protein (cupin superfamily)